MIKFSIFSIWDYTEVGYVLGKQRNRSKKGRESREKEGNMGTKQKILFLCYVKKGQIVKTSLELGDN